MYILIDQDGSLSLQEINDFGRFSIVESIDCPTLATASSALAGLAEPAEDDHYWIDANLVIDLSGKSENAVWINSFWDMLKKSEPYGYSDMENKRIKAHVEQHK